MALENYTVVGKKKGSSGKKGGKGKKDKGKKGNKGTKTNLDKQKEDKEKLDEALNSGGVTLDDLGDDELSLDNTTSTIQSALRGDQTLRAIEAVPYQFDESVDPRLNGTVIGRKYAEKIYGRLPLLFLTPCRPLFMNGFSDADKQTAMSYLVSKSEDNVNDLIEGEGKYYTAQFAYDEYWNYVNCMLAAVAIFLGLKDEKYGDKKTLSTMAWQDEQNDAYKTFFTGKENVIYYLDGLNSVSESFSNETTESQIASQINGYSDTVREIKYLVGDNNVASSVLDSASSTISSVSSALSGLITNVGGSLVGSISKNGLNSILNGGKIVFPEMWSNSSFDRSYSIEIKLRSPDHDSYSIFLNVIKPYCKLLALTLPQVSKLDDDSDNINAYNSPFLVKAYSKGLFNIDLGIITSLSATKGAEGAWNDDGLPTQIDITLEIKDLYKSLAMSGPAGFANLDWGQIVKNTTYMDFLANMAGLNLAQQELFRKIKMYFYLNSAASGQIPSRIFTKIDKGFSRLIGNLYNWTS